MRCANSARGASLIAPPVRGCRTERAVIPPRAPAACERLVHRARRDPVYLAPLAQRRHGHGGCGPRLRRDRALPARRLRPVVRVLSHRACSPCSPHFQLSHWRYFGLASALGLGLSQYLVTRSCRALTETAAPIARLPASTQSQGRRLCRARCRASSVQHLPHRPRAAVAASSPRP